MGSGVGASPVQAVSVIRMTVSTVVMRRIWFWHRRVVLSSVKVHPPFYRAAGLLGVCTPWPSRDSSCRVRFSISKSLSYGDSTRRRGCRSPRRRPPCRPVQYVPGLLREVRDLPGGFVGDYLHPGRVVLNRAGVEPPPEPEDLE